MPYCNRVVVEAPGKINLSLDVVGTNDEGFHLLEMVMQAISLSDILLLGRRQEDGVRITSSSSEIPEDDTNIVHKAADAFFRYTGIAPQGLAIHIDKRIPVQAGLAGGSADAAGTLRGLDRLFETALDAAQLQEIGLACGADVPFCLAGGCRHAQGVGEILTELPRLPECHLAVAKPARGMSTKAAFRLYDENASIVERPNTQAMLAAISVGDLAAVGKNMFNVFEQVSPAEDIGLLRGIMLCGGALGAVMTGTGTAVVGLFADRRKARRCVRHLQEQVAHAYLTRPVVQGARLLHWS